MDEHLGTVLAGAFMVVVLTLLGVAYKSSMLTHECRLAAMEQKYPAVEIQAICSNN